MAAEGGTAVCNTSGNATMVQYGESDFGYVQYSYTVKKLATTLQDSEAHKKVPIHLYRRDSDGRRIWISWRTRGRIRRATEGGKMTSTIASLFSGQQGRYVPCNTQGDFPELSIALTGQR